MTAGGSSDFTIIAAQCVVAMQTRYIGRPVWRLDSIDLMDRNEAVDDRVLRH